MQDLSPRQRDVYDFILSFRARRGFVPTYREIGDALGISSTNGVSDHMRALMKKGWVRQVIEGGARAYRTTVGVPEQRRATRAELDRVMEEGQAHLVAIQRYVARPGDARRYKPEPGDVLLFEGNSLDTTGLCLVVELHPATLDLIHWSGETFSIAINCPVVHLGVAFGLL